VDVVLIKVVKGIWRMVWPPLAGIAIGLIVAHAMRDRRAVSGTVNVDRNRPPAVSASSAVLVPELPPSSRLAHPRPVANQTP
jgi:hypothetical protein